jgi:hypothetical protein
VRARTSSRNPALRLLVVGLALLIVNLGVLPDINGITARG